MAVAIPSCDGGFLFRQQQNEIDPRKEFIMKKYLIAAVGSLALVLAGISYAAEQEAPKGDTKPAQETKKDSSKTKSASKDSKDAKKSSTKKCPDGQVYSKQDKKCVAKSAGAGTGTASTATAPAAPKY